MLAWSVYVLAFVRLYAICEAKVWSRPKNLGQIQGLTPS